MVIAGTCVRKFNISKAVLGAGCMPVKVNTCALCAQVLSGQNEESIECRNQRLGAPSRHKFVCPKERFAARNVVSRVWCMFVDWENGTTEYEEYTARSSRVQGTASSPRLLQKVAWLIDYFSPAISLMGTRRDVRRSIEPQLIGSMRQLLAGMNGFPIPIGGLFNHGHPFQAVRKLYWEGDFGTSRYSQKETKPRINTNAVCGNVLQQGGISDAPDL